MNVQEALTTIAEGWHDTIEPSLKEQKYGIAHNDLQNLSLAARAHVQEFARYHHGIRWMAHIELLKNALQERNEKNIQEYTDKVRTYLAQLRLAVQTENTFQTK